MANEIPTTELTCAQCGVTFAVVRKRGWSRQKFCGSECAAQAKREYRPAYLREWAKRAVSCSGDGDFKNCRDCGQRLPASAFHRSSNYADGRTSRCGSCVKLYSAKLRIAETPEHRLAKRERHRERSKRYREENRDKISERNRKNTAANTERHRNWRKRNAARFRDILKASKYRRRAGQLDGMNGRETREWLDAQNKVCHWCGCKCAADATIDHIQPLARGGAHERRNLCIACRSCNSRKHAKDPLDFAREIGKLL